MADEAKTQPAEKEEILRQAREDFTYCKEYWRENHEESEKDMDTAACIPPPDFQRDRDGRPCIWPDEVSQYVKQSNNEFRQASRAVKVSPRSEDATPEDAEHRQAYIRGIEYASKAPSIYTSAFESTNWSAFGYWRLKTIITGANGEQEPRLARIPNHFSVFPDPDAQEADFSDSNIYFVLCPPMRESAFARRFPNAEKKSFTKEDFEVASGWFHDGNIIPAEYWTRTEVDAEGGQKRYKVIQRIINGVEILETNEWIGSWIPIIGVFGEELYVKRGGQIKRLFLSHIRRARGPQQMLAYTASQEAEEFGLAPRAPLQGWKGTFDPEQHKNIHKVPAGYIEHPLPTDWNTNWGPPPLPIRVPFVPNSEAYEMAYERWRRAVQAAIAGNFLPTDAQRVNQKSGIALDKIESAQSIGNFHMVDNFVRALNNSGRQLNELITKLAELDSLPKQLLGKDQKDEDVVLRVRGRMLGQDPSSEELGEAKLFFAHRGQFEIAISDGPSHLSERDEASAFSDRLLELVPGMGLAPAITQQILAIAVKLKNIGTYGDEIHDLLSPPDPNNLPPQAKALLAQAQGQVQQLMAELQQLRLEKMAKLTEIEGKAQLAEREFATRVAEADKDRETKLAVAEITTKAQILSERVAAVEDLMKQFHAQAHELASLMQQQMHERKMAQDAQAATVAAAAAQPQPGESAAPGSV